MHSSHIEPVARPLAMHANLRHALAAAPGRLAVVLLLGCAMPLPAQAPRPADTANPRAALLRVCPQNSRYFADADGRAVYLAGSHIWSSVQDWGTVDPPPRLDYARFLDFLDEHGHNFTRLWAWEHTRWTAWSTDDFFIEPSWYRRTGPGLALDGKPRFDLDQFDPAYFDRLRERVTLAAERGIYVGVMLFQGWSVESKGLKGQPYRSHPFHRDNNINGIDGDPDGNGQATEIHTLAVPANTELQERYAARVIDTLNHLDNIIWEIGNEFSRDSGEWQHHMIRFVKSYQARKPKQHPVWMTVAWAPGNNRENNRQLADSPADAISPNHYGPDYRGNIPAADGDKVILNDTDHLWGIGGDRAWVWKCFTRGLNPIFMDPQYGIPGWQPTPDPDARSYREVRRSLGHTRRLAERLDLSRMIPQPADVAEPASTRHCLYHAGNAYVVYQPEAGSFTLILPAGRYRCEWLNVLTGELHPAEASTLEGGTHTLSSPFPHDAVLIVRRVPEP